MGFLYFAYGSNMLPARLQARCSTARVIGTATAQNFELNFSKLGKDSSGKATLVESAIGGTVTPGVLFEIERIELHHLDQAEGAGYWSAPIEWSSLNVSAWSAFGLSGRCFWALVDGNPERCVV